MRRGFNAAVDSDLLDHGADGKHKTHLLALACCQDNAGLGVHREADGRCVYSYTCRAASPLTS